MTTEAAGLGLTGVLASLRSEAASCEETVAALPDEGRWKRERDYYRGYASGLRHAADAVAETLGAK